MSFNFQHVGYALATTVNVAQIKLGDEIEYAGHKGKVTWSTSELIDITFPRTIGPIAYETLSRASRLALNGYMSNNYVFTFDINAPIVREFRLLGNLNDEDQKCCCGGDSIGATRHPKYCPSYSDL